LRSAVLTLIFALTPILALAKSDDPKIEHLTAVATNGQVSVHFAMLHAFDRPQTIEAIQSGVSTSFTYIVEVFRDRPYWLDEGIARSRIEVTCSFNSVTREYLLNYRRDRKLVKSETFGDLATLQQRMRTIDELNLFDIGKHKPYKLKVRVKADLMRGWLLYFIPWEVSTRWREVRVTTTETTKP
jgi:hypothetical protein